MQNNENFDEQINTLNISPIYLLLGGVIMTIINYFLYLSGSVYFMLIIVTTMSILAGLIGLVTPNKSRSYNIQILISIVGLIIGVIIFYLLTK